MANCESYCSHGGVCELEAGHEGRHDSRYCQWSDDEALDKGTADAVLRNNGQSNGYTEAEIERAIDDPFVTETAFDRLSRAARKN